MTHNIDFEGIEEKLFLIQKIVLGSCAYCEERDIGRNIFPYGEAVWSDYSGRLHSLISSYAIECAVKTRMVQDFVMANCSDADLVAIDEESRDGFGIGIVHTGKVNLTVRESCNKIIHATKVELSWSEINHRISEKKIEYWNGGYNLHGRQAKHAWHIELNMQAWAVAMENFHSILDERVDWYEVYNL
jgi:hypothetical protein